MTAGRRYTAIETFNRHHVGIHERFAAGEADLLGWPAIRRDLVKELHNLLGRQINEPVVPWARLDVARLTREVTQRAGVEP